MSNNRKWKWSKRSKRNSTRGKGSPLPDGEASSWGSNDRHPIAPAAPQRRRGPRTEIEQWRLRLVRVGHHEHRLRGGREQGMRVWQGLGATHVPYVQSCPMAEPKAISGCSRSVWRASEARLILPWPAANGCAEPCQGKCDQRREGLADGSPLVPLLAAACLRSGPMASLAVCSILCVR